jgi:nucleoside-diphosphate-sugar epimerase
VTGGAGFIGSNIVRRLCGEGYAVRVLDNYSTGKEANLEGLAKVEIIKGDICDSDIVRKSLNGVRYILHQAAVSSVSSSLDDPLYCNKVNIEGTLNLMAAAGEMGVERIVYASSSAVYGDTARLPVAESTPANPLSPYAVSKYAGELYGRVFSDLYGLQVVGLRYFNIFGPYQDPASEYAAVIPKFITAMLRGEPPVIFGDGEQTRDFTYIENAVEANILACRSPKVGRGETINIACGASYSLNTLVRHLNGILGTQINPLYMDPKPGDIRHSRADTASAKELIGYEVKIEFREGLKRVVEWYQRSEHGTH